MRRRAEGAGAAVARADAELAVGVVAPGEHLPRHGEHHHVPAPARHEGHVPARHGRHRARRGGAAGVAVAELAVLAGAPRVELSALGQRRGEEGAAADPAAGPAVCWL